MKSKNELIVYLYNKLNGTRAIEISELPEKFIFTISIVREQEILCILVGDDLRNGLSRQMITNKYGVKDSSIISIGRKLGILNYKNTGANGKTYYGVTNVTSKG